MTNSVGTFEAKTHFAKLIQQVMKGEEILITKRGQPVAKIIPLEKKQNALAAQSAAKRLKLLAKEIGHSKFDWDEWKEYRDTGRK
jgi:prevent-host-death family protein